MSDEDNGAMVVEPDISDMFFPEIDDDNDGTNQSSNHSDSSADNQANLNLMDGMYTELGENRGYKCTICHKLLKSSSHLLGHLRTHTGEKPYHCEICNKTFSEASSLKVHTRIHTGERPFECKLCGKRFTQSCNMSSHMRRHESGTLPRVPMHHSHFDRRPSQNYQNQQRPAAAVASPKAGTKCCVCEETFQDPDLLKIHEETHAPESPFKCRYCTSVFSLIKNLKAHVNRHLAFDANGREIYLRNTNAPPSSAPSSNGTGGQMVSHPHYPGNGMKLQPVQTNMGVKYIPMNSTGKMPPLTSRPGLTITPTSKFNPAAKMNLLAGSSSAKNPNIPALSLIPRPASIITKTGNPEKPYQCTQCKILLVQAELSEHIKMHNARRLRRKRMMMQQQQGKGNFPEAVSLSAEVELVRKSSNGGSAKNADGGDEDSSEISITPIKKEPMVININTGEGGKSIQQQMKEKVVTNPVLKISSVASVDQNFLKKLDQLEYKRKSAPPAMPTMLSMLQRNSNGMAANKMIRLENRMGQMPSTSGGSGPYQCKICFKQMPDAFTYKAHMRTHMTQQGEKPFKCKFCQRQFAQAINLQSHLRTHSGEKQFTCPFCTKKFSRSASMYGHMQVHVFRTSNGIKMYKCSYCMQPFAKSAQLSNHIDTFLALFKCCICQQQCDDADALANHQKVAHNKTITTSPPTGPPTVVPRTDREVPPLRFVPMSQLQQRLQTRSNQPIGQMTPQQRMHLQRLQQHRLQQYRLQQKIAQQRQQQQQQQMMQSRNDTNGDDDDDDDDEQMLLPDFLQPEVSMESGDEDELIFDGKEQKPKQNGDKGNAAVVKLNTTSDDGDYDDVSIEKGEENGNDSGGVRGGLYDSDVDDDFDEDGYEGSDDEGLGFMGGEFEQTFNEEDDQSTEQVENDNQVAENDREIVAIEDENDESQSQSIDQSKEISENGSSSDKNP